MSVYNEDNKFKERKLCRKEKNLYIDRKITLNSMKYSRYYNMNEC